VTSLRTAVIVPSARRIPALLRCLESLEAMATRPHEVIVVFQGDRDDALRDEIRHRHPDVQVLWAARQGAAAARNAGAAQSGGELLLFVDDDCIVEPDWNCRYLDAFAQDPALMIASGQVRPFGSHGQANDGLALQLDPVPRTFDGPANPVGSVDRTCNLAVRRSAFVLLGGFDEGLGAGTRFPSAEDTDFAYRAMKAGLRQRYLPDVVVLHEQWRTESQAAAVERGYAVGLGAFLITHVRRGDLYAVSLVPRLTWWLGVRPVLEGVAHRRRARRQSGLRYLTGIPRGMVRGVRRPAEHHRGPWAGIANRR
jgi:GT2 family glycosyltransferase